MLEQEHLYAPPQPSFTIPIYGFKSTHGTRGELRSTVAGEFRYPCYRHCWYISMGSAALRVNFNDAAANNHLATVHSSAGPLTSHDYAGYWTAYTSEQHS